MVVEVEDTLLVAVLVVVVRDVRVLLTLSLFCFSASGFLVIVFVRGTLPGAGRGFGAVVVVADFGEVAVFVSVFVVGSTYSPKQ